MIYFSIDIETDGPIIAKHSMISFGVVKVEKGFKDTFYGELKPIGDSYVPKALSISGFSREETLKFRDAKEVMLEFAEWLKKVNPTNDRIIFCADNNGFDFAFFNWYALTYLDENPFGHTSLNINSLYKGLTKNMRKNIRHLKETEHTHNALDDAKGNAEALLKILKEINS